MADSAPLLGPLTRCLDAAKRHSGRSALLVHGPRGSGKRHELRLAARLLESGTTITAKMTRLKLDGNADPSLNIDKEGTQDQDTNQSQLKKLESERTLAVEIMDVDLAGAREESARICGGAGGFEEDHALRGLLDAAEAKTSAENSTIVTITERAVVAVVYEADLWFNKAADSKLVLTLAQFMARKKTIAVILIATDANRLHPLVRKAVAEEAEIQVPTPEGRELIWRQALRMYAPHVLPQMSGPGIGNCDKSTDEDRSDTKIKNIESGTKEGTLNFTGEVDEDSELEMIRKVNARCHGWLPGDIVDVCHFVDSAKDLEQQVDTYVPSMFRSEAGSDTPYTVVSADRVTTTWDDIGGLEDTKQALREMIVWPTLFKDTFDTLGVSPPGGVLFYGPPGTGKTLLASAVAKETHASLLSVSISDVVRGHVGESERMIATIFAMARRAAPCVLFFDEFQAMFGSRASSGELGRKMIAQFLQETDTRVPGLVIMASTNVPEAIDPALLRPGRFDRKLYVPLPDKAGREVILQRRQEKMQSWNSDVDLTALVDRTTGWSGAELVSLCDRAALEALRRNGQDVVQADFDAVIQRVQQTH